MSKEKQMVNDLIEIFDEEYSKRSLLTPQNTAEKLMQKGYRKQSEGKWEKRAFIIFDSEQVGYRCSECNTTWGTDTPYCPNCGAKMKGDDGE